MPDAGYRMLDPRCSMLDDWMLNARCSVLDKRSKQITVKYGEIRLIEWGMGNEEEGMRN